MPEQPDPVADLIRDAGSAAAHALADPRAERESICHTVTSSIHGTFAVHGPLSIDTGEHVFTCPLADATGDGHRGVRSSG